jgi:hypothetical protein
MRKQKQFGLSSVLVDNTTLFGARRALETWPPNPDDWNSNPLAVDLRALMVALEMMVLHKELVVDGSSRNDPVWPDLSETPVGSDAILRDTHLLPDPSVHLAVLKSATQSLCELIENGSLNQERRRIHQSEPAAVLPSLYTDPREFFSLTSASFPGPRDAPEEVLRPLVELLDRQPSRLRTYATFVFRGIYYQHLAHCLCISYQPHSWRARILEVQAKKPFHFAEYAFGVVAELRATLTDQLNAEFGGLVFSGEFPVLASYIVGQASRRSELIPIARELRRNPQVAAFRKWVEQLDRAMTEEASLSRIRAGQTELRQLLVEMQKEFRLDQPEQRDSGATTMKIKVGVPLGIASMETEVGPKMPSEWRGTFRRRPHLLFLKDLMRKSAELRPFASAYAQLDP